MAQTIKSQNLSIMLTDIQGYSTTASNVSREELMSLIRKHNQLMKPVIGAYGGTIIKMIGDAFLCTFPGATNAVICAIIIQLLLKEYNQKLEGKKDAQKLNLRVVINSGDVTLENNDIFGTAVNITSRIEGLDCFPGGSVGISEATYLMMDRTEIYAEKIGPKMLKGVNEPVVVYRVPLEKQKLNRLPLQLSKLVEKVINSKGDADNMGEWHTGLDNFLKQVNWSDGIDFASKKLGVAKDVITKTFGKKSVLETSPSNLVEAPYQKRFLSTVIDYAIIAVFSIFLTLGWGFFDTVFCGGSKPAQKASEHYYEGGERNAAPSHGIIYKMIRLNVHYPLVFWWLYFMLFWKLKNATLGQIAIGTAVVSGDNKHALSYATAAKRSALFVLVLILPFLAIFMLVGEKQALYDKLCYTKVVCKQS